jgi:transcription elongation factor GreA
MSVEKIPITPPGAEKLKGELARLKEERPRISREIGAAIEQGDLSENAEYHAAKDKQATYARRFEELETMLTRVRLVESLERPAGVALPGTEIALAAVDGNPEEAALSLWLLGDGDQGIAESVVSFRAPVGQAVLGRKEGDEVEVPRERGVRRYRIERVAERLP